jgi:hypothetical protein
MDPHQGLYRQWKAWRANTRYQSGKHASAYSTNAGSMVDAASSKTKEARKHQIRTNNSLTASVGKAGTSHHTRTETEKSELCCLAWRHKPMQVPGGTNPCKHLSNQLASPGRQLTACQHASVLACKLCAQCRLCSCWKLCQQQQDKSFWRSNKTVGAGTGDCKGNRTRWQDQLQTGTCISSTFFYMQVSSTCCQETEVDSSRHGDKQAIYQNRPGAKLHMDGVSAEATSCQEADFTPPAMETSKPCLNTCCKTDKARNCTMESYGQITTQAARRQAWHQKKQQHIQLNPTRPAMETSRICLNSRCRADKAPTCTRNPYRNHTGS